MFQGNKPSSAYQSQHATSNKMQHVNGVLIDGPVQLADGDTLRTGHHTLHPRYNPNQQRSVAVTAAYPQPKQQQQQKQQQIHNANNTSYYDMLYEAGGGSGMPSAADVVCAPVSSPVALVQQQQQQHQVQQQPAPSTGSGVASGFGGDGLPGLIEFSTEAESTLLAAICNSQASDQSSNPTTHRKFLLAPVYTMYMMLCYRLSEKYTGGRRAGSLQPHLSFNDKLHALAPLIHKMVNCMRKTVDANRLEKHVLFYWLANTAKLLYFLEQDVHLAQVSFDAQLLLVDTVQLTFKYLVAIMQHQLDQVLVAFFDPSDHLEEVSDAKLNGVTQDNMLTHYRPTLNNVVGVLNETLQLLRGSGVNSKFTSQLFSQLFQFISDWLVNQLERHDKCSGWCSRYWGYKLTRRLAKLQAWAKRQGLECVADCQLTPIVQATFLLAAAKYDYAELSTISSNCFLLNSLQIKRLLDNYVLALDEPPLSAALCANLIAFGRKTVEGRPLNVKEKFDMQLYLPEDGFSCKFTDGLPVDLLVFLESMQKAGLCQLYTYRSDSWERFVVDEQQQQQQQKQQQQIDGQSIQQQQPKQYDMFQGKKPSPVYQSQHATSNKLQHVNGVLIDGPVQQQKQQSQQQRQAMSDVGPIEVKLLVTKKFNSFGMSIVSASGPNQTDTGIFVKSVLSGGAAFEGRLSAGDQLLAVDTASLVNVSMERATQLLMSTGQSVLFTVAKDAAAYYNTSVC